MHRQLLFTDQNVYYEFNECSSYIYVESIIKNYKMKSLTITYQYQDQSIKTVLDKTILSPFNLSIHVKENHFIDGYMAYISLFFLLEKTNFFDYLPFQFYVPCQLSLGDCSDSQILQYMYTPLKLMLKLHYRQHGKNLIYHYFNTITYFIETYKDLFYTGPALNPSLINDLSLIMMNAMINKPSLCCDVCHYQYKNGLIKCLICFQYVNHDKQTCYHCHRIYGNHECKDEDQSKNDILTITNDIKLLQDKLESLTQELSSQSSKMQRHKHKKRI